MNTRAIVSAALVIALQANVRADQNADQKSGDQKSGAPSHNFAPRRPPPSCSVHVTHTGITVDGKTVNRKQAVVLCRRSMRANVELDKDRKKGAWEALKKDLVAAKITIQSRSSVTNSKECLDNPLAKGCL